MLRSCMYILVLRPFSLSFFVMSTPMTVGLITPYDDSNMIKFMAWHSKWIEKKRLSIS